jgi:TolA-binding protein
MLLGGTDSLRAQSVLDASQTYTEAMAFLQEGNKAQAKEKMTAFMRRFPKDARAAEIQYCLGVMEEEMVPAVTGLRWTIKNYKESEWAKKAQLQLGFIYFLMENYLQAANEFRSYVSTYSKDPQEALAFYWLGISSLKAGSSMEALSALERAWELSQSNPLGPQVAASLCVTLRNNKQYYEAVTVGEKILTTESSSPFADSIRETLQTCYDRLGSAPVSEPTASPAAPPISSEQTPGPGVSPSEPSAQPYSIQVGVFAQSKWAENMEEDLRARGYDVYVVRGYLDGKSVFKVRVGRFATQEEAQAQAEQIMQKESFKIFIVRD